MRHPFILRNLALRPFYLGFGAYLPLLKMLRLKWPERIFIILQSILPRHDMPLRLPATLERIIGEPVEALLFRDVSGHSDTNWTGVFNTTQRLYCAQVYKHPEDILFKLQQVKFVREHFAGKFIFPHHVAAEEGMLISQAVRHKREIAKSDFIEDKLVQITHDFIRTKALRKHITDIIPLGFYALCHRIGKGNVADRLAAWQQHHNAVMPIIPIHGNLMPGNIFISDDEKIVLVNYDRAGWHVPFCDVFHFILQPFSLHKKSPGLNTLLLKKDWLQTDWGREALVLYLVDQLDHDLTDYHDMGYRHESLQHEIANKLDWLHQALDAAQKGER